MREYRFQRKRLSTLRGRQENNTDHLPGLLQEHAESRLHNSSKSALSEWKRQRYQLLSVCAIQAKRKQMLVSQLVSWCFEPSQPQRITSGLNTNFTLYPSHSFHQSSYHKTCLQPIYIPRALNTGTCIQQGDLFYSAGLHRIRCQPQPTQGKIGRGFGKNAGEWTGSVEISK